MVQAKKAAAFPHAQECSVHDACNILPKSQIIRGAMVLLLFIRFAIPTQISHHHKCIRNPSIKSFVQRFIMSMSTLLPNRFPYAFISTSTALITRQVPNVESQELGRAEQEYLILENTIQKMEMAELNEAVHTAAMKAAKETLEKQAVQREKILLDEHKQIAGRKAKGWLEWRRSSGKE